MMRIHPLHRARAALRNHGRQMAAAGLAFGLLTAAGSALAAPGPSLVLQRAEGSRVLASGKGFPANAAVKITAQMGESEQAASASGQTNQRGRLLVSIATEGTGTLWVSFSSGNITKNATLALSGGSGDTTRSTVAPRNPRATVPPTTVVEDNEVNDETASESDTTDEPGDTAPTRSTTAPETSSGVKVSDRTNENFSAAGLSSVYHLYSSGVSGSPKGLVVYLDGDGQYAIENPNSGYVLGGSNGLVSNANEKGYAVLAILSPDTSSSTWWRNGTENAKYVTALTKEILSEMQLNNVWFVGFSGGSQLTTKFLVPAHASELPIAGTMVFGGGGSPGRSGGNPSFPMYWVTGTADTAANAGDGYDALGDAKRGASFYENLGVQTNIETPSGVDHGGVTKMIGPKVASVLP